MKKRLSIVVAVYHLISIAAFSQEVPDSVYDTLKRHYFYVVKIETENDKNINAVLSRFSADTVFVIDFDKHYNVLSGINFTIIRNEIEWGIAATDLKTIKIIKDRHIILAEDHKKEKAKAIRRQFIGGSDIPTDIISAGVFAIVNTGTAVGVMAISKAGKKFELNGSKTKYEEMLSKLSPKKDKKGKEIIIEQQ